MKHISEKQYKNIINSVQRELKNIMQEEREMMILKEYEAYDLFYNTALNEGLSEKNKEDLIDLTKTLGHLGKVCARLIYRLVKWGAKESVKLCVKAAKYAIKQGKAHPEVCKNLFYSLLFFCIGYSVNSVKDWYNNKPVIENTHIEQRTVNGLDSLVVYEDGKDTVLVVQQPNKDEAPVVKTGTTKKNDNVQNSSAEVQEWVTKMKSENRRVVVIPKSSYDLSVYSLPIHPLQKGEQKIEITKPSKEMVQAIAEIETFVDHLYDTANRNKKLTMKDILNPKADITIGYGRAVKSIAERKKLFGKTITKEQALLWFEEDLQEHVNIVNNKTKQLPYYSKVNISQGLYDFLVSVSFNAGSGNIFGYGKKPMSEFWRRMNGIRIDGNGKYIQQDMDYALAKINTQNTGSASQGGLKIRRRAEYWISKQPYGTIKSEIYHLK